MVSVAAAIRGVVTLSADDGITQRIAPAPGVAVHLYAGPIAEGVPPIQCTGNGCRRRFCHALIWLPVSTHWR